MKYQLPVTHVTRCASLSCEINKANSLGVFPGISLKNRHIYFHSIFPYNMEHVAQLLRKYREYQFKICQLTHSIGQLINFPPIIHSTNSLVTETIVTKLKVSSASLSNFSFLPHWKRVSSDLHPKQSLFHGNSDIITEI
jgi:hypothetical protein